MGMNNPLEEKDLKVILNEVGAISPDNIVNFGLQLKDITLGMIKSFEIRYNRNMRDCLREILYRRLNQEVPLTWLEITAALRAETVNEGRIAKKIETKFSQLHSGHCRSFSQDVPPSPLPRIKRPSSSPVMRNRCEHAHPKQSSLSKLIDHVERTYRSCKVETSPLVIKWPPTPSKDYINLACIDRQAVTGKSNSYKEITEAMIRDGNVDAINATKGPIEFNEVASKILIHSNTKKRLVLLEGAPGVGKSTFAFQYCRMWEKGDIGQQYQLVLLLRLRDETINRAVSLKEIICDAMEGITEDDYDNLISTHGAHVMIILEGFDELPHSSREDKSVFMMLVAGKILPLATIIVTSRPWATKAIFLKHGDRICQHIEILGFTSDQVTKYIESTIPQDIVSELICYLKRYPQIRAGMYIPLNSAIVVTVYKENHENGWPMPKTLTEQYTALVSTILVRYLCAYPEYNTTCIQTFQDLPEVMYRKFCVLCELAYGGIFSRDHIKLMFKNLPSDFDNLGLMDSVTELYVTRGTISSHNFLHLTFQEYFAALHISTMSPTVQLEHFQKYERDSRFKVVLQFLAGYTKLSCFSEFKDAIKCFFQVPRTYLSSRKYHLPCNTEVDGNLVNWIFEAENDDILMMIQQEKTTEFVVKQSMIMMEYVSLGYCIANSNSQWVLSLERTDLGEEEIEMLMSGATVRKGTGKVVGLKGSVDNPDILFTGLKRILNLFQLSMSLSKPCDCITWPDLSALKTLEFDICGGTNWKLCTLLPQLPLESLTLHIRVHDGQGLVKEDCEAISNVIKSKQLKELCIHGKRNSIDRNGVDDITSVLANNQSVEKLEFECECTFSDRATDCLIQFVTKSTTLECILIKSCQFTVNRLLKLANTIENTPKLNKELSDLMFEVNGDNEAKDWAQLLIHFTDIIRNDYDHPQITGITASGAKVIAQALHNNSKLEKLNLSNNNIGDAGTKAMAEALCHNSTLWWLNLSNNNISDVGALVLADALNQNSTQRYLDLSHNTIGDSGAIALIQTQHNHYGLDLRGNDKISQGGFHQIIVEILPLNITEDDIHCKSSLMFSQRCKKYAIECPHYNTVKRRVSFSD